MITIRSSNSNSEAALVGLEATLTTTRGVYTIFSNGPMIDPASPFGGGLFGAMSWPRSRFQFAPGLVLEQQMFLPHAGFAAAFSWQLHGQSELQVRLAIKPFFSGCGPRSYRDAGFRFDTEQDGGRLTWLPNVRGPKIIADTNGRYRDEPARSLDCLCPEAMESASAGDMVAPGTFEFELNELPSVLIIRNDSSEGRSNLHIGTFLAGLMPTTVKAPTFDAPASTEPAACLVQAA